MAINHDPNLLRTIRLRPYRKGHGPTFTLRTWDTGDANHGHYRLRYELRQHEHDNGSGLALPTRYTKTRTTVLFAGADFGCSPLHAIDSDENTIGLLHFLTLRPGDTDA